MRGPSENRHGVRLRIAKPLRRAKFGCGMFLLRRLLYAENVATITEGRGVWLDLRSLQLGPVAAAIRCGAAKFCSATLHVLFKVPRVPRFPLAGYLLYLRESLDGGVDNLDQIRAFLPCVSEGCEPVADFRSSQWSFRLSDYLPDRISDARLPDCFRRRRCKGGLRNCRNRRRLICIEQCFDRFWEFAALFL